MELRRNMIRAMIACLLVAAVLGAVTVLVGSSRLGERVVMTMVATAVAIGMAIRPVLQTEKPTSRTAGLTGLCVLLVSFLLVLVQIWDVPLPGRSFDLVETTFAILGTGFVAWFCLGFLHFPWSRVASLTGTGVAAGVLGLLLVSIWGNGGNSAAEAAFRLSLFGGLAAVCLLGAGTDNRHWRYLGVLAAAVGFLSGFIGQGLLGDFTLNPASRRMLLLAAVIAHAVVLELLPLSGIQRLLARGTILLGIVTAAAIEYFAHTFDAGRPFSDQQTRVIGALSILTVCSTLAVLLAAVLRRRIDKARIAPPNTNEVSLTCPVCGLAQSVGVGKTPCPKCRAIIHIEIEEPKCDKCGFSLLYNPSDRCPECGTVVAALPLPA